MSTIEGKPKQESETRAERVEREDLVLFINACFASTGQREFYSSKRAQQVSIDFIHRYILGNYRQLYARTLSLGVNHFNQAKIVENLLASGSPPPGPTRDEENALITAVVERLPPPRVYRLFERLRRNRVNNRRTRAVISRYLLTHRDVTFDAVKYRRRVRLAGAHAHVRFDPETSLFVQHAGRIDDPNRFTVAGYRTYVEARYSNGARAKLPFTVAEGFAGNRPRDQKALLERSKDQLTSGERFRVQARAGRLGVDVSVELSAMPLTRLAIYISSLDPDERARRSHELGAALRESADRTFVRAPSPLGRVAVVADRSYSTSGSAEKRRRPLAVTLAAVELLRRAAESCVVFWAPSLGRPHVEVTPHGQTDLASPLLAALRSEPDDVIILSDGFENAPVGLADQVVAVARARISSFADLSVVHVNPVFDADNLAPRTLGPSISTVGLRDAEDLLTTLGFARFVSGAATMAEFDTYLSNKTHRFVEGAKP